MSDDYETSSLPEPLAEAIRDHEEFVQQIEQLRTALPAIKGPLGDLLRALVKAWDDHTQLNSIGGTTEAERLRLVEILQQAVSVWRWLTGDE